MSNQSDVEDRSGNVENRSGNIDRIRQLLLKLEEVALRDSEASVSEVSVSEASVSEASVSEASVSAPIVNLGSSAASDSKAVDDAPRAVAAASTELSTLQRGTALARRPVVPVGPLEIGPPSLRDLPALSSVPAAAGQVRGVSIALASFALGIAAAGALILALEPLKQSLGVGTQAAAPSSAKPADKVETAARSDMPADVQVARAPATPSGEAETAPARTPAPTVETVQIVVEARPQREEASVSAATTSTTTASTTTASTTMPAPVPAKTPALSAATESTVKASVEAVASTSQSAQHVLQIAERLDLRAGERRGIDVRIDPAPAEAARLLVVLRNVPAWLSLSKGGAIGNDIWLLPAHQAGNVAIEVADGARGTAEIKVQLASLDGRIFAEAPMTVRAIAAPSAPPGTITAAAPQSLPLGDDLMILRLQTRGELLLDTGEVEAARTLFRTAAEAGSVAAALRLAETYDPAEMPRLGMMEAAADPAQAVRWYERAQALGSPVAASRLVALGRR